MAARRSADRAVGGAGEGRWQVKNAVLVAVVLAITSLSAQQAPDRSKAPVTGPPPALKLPPIQKRALANGLPVWIVEMHEVPVANVSLHRQGRRGGRSGRQVRARELHRRDARRRRGHAQRARSRRCDRVPRRVAQHRQLVRLSSIRLHTPVSKLDDALPLMADVALRPTFRRPSSSGCARSG